jgi:archaellum component FlaG (FlaF/FlaG flagellin family)
LVFGVLIFIVFLVIAFFQVSELSLLAFIAKKIKDSFFDVSKKFQINYTRTNDPVEITIAKSKQEK